MQPISLTMPSLTESIWRTGLVEVIETVRRAPCCLSLIDIAVQPTNSVKNFQILTWYPSKFILFEMNSYMISTSPLPCSGVTPTVSLQPSRSNFYSGQPLPPRCTNFLEPTNYFSTHSRALSPCQSTFPIPLFNPMKPHLPRLRLSSHLDD